jgi:phosphoribosyl 1,2-cyclic phosphodiesterase
MIRFSVLASSSRGNATVVSGGGTHVLVDTGISALRIRKGLSECGLSDADISAVFFTHEHHDHVCGLGVLSKKRSLNLYCSRYLSRDLRDMAPNASFSYLEPGQTVQVGALSVTPFCVSHDAVDPLGYVFECNGARLGYVTDTGIIMKGMPELLAGVQGLYLESNYDVDMLENSGRTPDLIRRISGRWGHLSNDQACEFIRTIGHPGLQHLVLAHISPECNTPAKAAAAMRATLDELSLPAVLHCAQMASRLDWIEISGNN